YSAGGRELRPAHGLPSHMGQLLRVEAGQAEHARETERSFRHCVNADWTPKNRAEKLTKIKIKKDEETATQPFTPEEMDQIFAGIPSAGFEGETAKRVRTAVLIQRHAGLAIQDAIKLLRKQVIWDGTDDRIKINR